MITSNAIGSEASVFTCCMKCNLMKVLGEGKICKEKTQLLEMLSWNCEARLRLHSVGALQFGGCISGRQESYFACA